MDLPQPNLFDTDGSPVYLQSGVIPYRKARGTLELLLVTSWKGTHWIIPKGLIEPGLSAQDSALKEALEEAGAVGTIEGDSLGSYEYKKWGGTCQIEVFPMLVTEILEDWQESGLRKREWFSLEDAARLLRKKPLKKMLKKIPQLLP